MTKRGRPAHRDQLTPAEWRIVEGVRHGLTNPRIAARCGISTDGVKFHVGNILAKLGLSRRSELRRWSGVRSDSHAANRASKKSASAWRLGQVARVTRNVDAMVAWFDDVLGLQPIIQFQEMAFFNFGQTRLYIGKGDPACNSLIYFAVDDVHGEVAHLEAQGSVVRSAPHRIHVRADGAEEWMAFIDDPDGSPIGLMSTISPLPGVDQ